MKKGKPLFFLSIFVWLCSCEQYTYLPKSAKQKYFARPHIQFMMAVVEFREAAGVWPGSVYQLASQSGKNKKIVDDFQYQSVTFTNKKNDKLSVSFDDYKKQLYLDEEDKIDLNRLRGTIAFFKSDGKFIWKVRMK